MKTKIALIVALYVIVYSAQARQISENQARTIAGQFFNVNMPQQPATMKGKGATAAYYVFNNPEQLGWVIVAGDDRARTILAYGDENYFDPTEVPECVQDWLNDYAEQLAKLDRVNPKEDNDPPIHTLTSDNKVRIAPLLSCNWAQGLPFNQQCATYTSSGSTNYCPAGCVAIAMAQILYYYKSATECQSIPAYTSTSLSQYMSELPATTFDYSIMNDWYDKVENTSASAQETARLVRYCAQSVKMDFGQSSSSATSQRNAFVYYFGYDKDAQQLARTDFSAAEWEDMVYNELANGRPVFISARKTSGGHAFVCDGYTDGLYHINWGWRGHQNGYFALNALNDDNAGGTGAAVGDEGYTINVQIMIGLQPDLGTASNTNGNIVGLYRDCEAGSTSYSRSNSSENFSGVSLTAYYWNYSSQTYTYDLGWGVYDSDGNLVSTHNAVSGRSLGAGNYSIVTASLNLGKNLTGTYYLKPICRLKGSSTFYPCRGSGVKFIKATITTTRLNLKVYSELDVMNLKVNSVTASSIRKVGSPLQLTLNVTNQGMTDYNSIYMWVNGTKISGTYTDIGIGETGNVVMNYTPSATGSTSFEFTADENGTKTLKTMSVTINSATAASISGATHSSVVGTTFNASIDAKNTNTSTYNDYIVAKLYKKENNAGTSGYYCSAQSQIVNLASNSTQTVEFAFTNLDYNETYFVTFYYYNNGEQVRINGTASRKVESPYLVTSVTLDEHEMTLNVGEEFTLTPTVLPDTADYKTVNWASSNPSVASVNANGLVTALSEGTATITATTTDGSNLSDSCVVTVVEEPVFTAGDVNDDGAINIGDYADVASYILEQDPQPFNFAAADIDCNNEINVGDLAGVAYLALHYEENAQCIMHNPKCIIQNEECSIDATVESNIVAINMSNNVGITALQMDLRLPKGMTLVEASLTNRASASHQVAFSQLANSDYRLLASSSICKTFSGTFGTVLTLTLAGTPGGNGSLSNIVLASPTATCYSIEDINLNFTPTGLDNVYSTARIYSEGGNIVIVAPHNGTAQIILPNGMNKTVKIMPGRNIYPAPTQGVVIVKMGDSIKKIQLK
ncbi:MAG: C10 family peptidase [Muribaculaceae bacterium]|nr:C10 family peptidase [Muribaculaceae bacterium]